MSYAVYAIAYLYIKIFRRTNVFKIIPRQIGSGNRKGVRKTFKHNYNGNQTNKNKSSRALN